MPKRPSRPRSRAVPALLAALAVALLAFPALAAAERQTVTFDAAPPGPDQPVQQSSEAPKITFLPHAGFRPYRDAVGAAKAQSGEFVGDITRCTEEAMALGEDASACDTLTSVSTTAQLAETARSITLFAGTTFDGPGEATLRVFNSSGIELGHDGPKPVSEDQTKTQFKVEPIRPGGNPFDEIASFKFEGEAALAIDSVTADFPGGAPPDFGITTTSQVIPIVQGGTANVPIHLQRINESQGQIELFAQNLPQGVHMVAPRQVRDTAETDMTLELEADPRAPDTNFQPTEAKIFAIPIAGSAGHTVHVATFGVRVAQDFSLSSGSQTESVEEAPALDEEGNPPRSPHVVDVPVPDCAPTDIPIDVTRDFAMRRDVTLALEDGVHEGETAEFLPEPVVHPGGSTVAERTLRLRFSQESELGNGPIPIVVDGFQDPHGPKRELVLQAVRTDSAKVVSNTGPYGYTPRFEHPGSAVVLHGEGFCPGTKVEVGGDPTLVPTKFIDDHTVEFQVPRLATTGKIWIHPGGKYQPYTTENKLIVDSVRNVNGFPFENYGRRHHLHLDEFVKAFGPEEIFTQINPCWPFADCSIDTGFVDPGAALIWGALDIVEKFGSGQCFGMDLAIQLFDSGVEKRKDYTDIYGARSGWEMSTLDGPGPALSDFIGAMQMRQYSKEGVDAFLHRPKSIQAQLAILDEELKHERMPMISLRHGATDFHNVLAYDMEMGPNEAKIYVYNPNEPFLPGEDDEEGYGELHDQKVAEGIITITKRNGSWNQGTWSFPFELGEIWSNRGDDGSLWVVPTDIFPADQHLPDAAQAVEGAKYVASLVTSGLSAKVDELSPGAAFLPHARAVPGHPAAGELIGTADPDRPLSETLRGERSGPYTETYMAPGFVASTGSVATKDGVTDTVVGKGESITFEGGMARPLQLQVAQSGGATQEAATVHAHGSAGGADTVGLGKGGDLTYAHSGAPTKITFTYTEVRKEGGPSTFVSPPVAVGDGERLTVTPLDRDLTRVRVRVHGGGRPRTLVLHTHGGAPGRLMLGKAKRVGNKVVLHFRVSRLHGAAMVGAALQLMAGGHAVANHAVAEKAKDGAQTIVWKLPHGIKQGALKLSAHLRLVDTGSRGQTVTGSVSAQGVSAVR